MDGGGALAEAATRMPDETTRVGGSCVSDSDCEPDGTCGFRSASGCMARGRCFPKLGAVCAAASPGCACDGTFVNLICNGLPGGYVRKPLRHVGKCSPDPRLW
jgi:hypothetical protein